MRISDWSSDVCSSDLGDADLLQEFPHRHVELLLVHQRSPLAPLPAYISGEAQARTPSLKKQTGRGGKPKRTVKRRSASAASLAAIGRASCREGVCQYV